VASLAFGPDGEGHVFAGGAGLYVTNQSGILPLLDWHPITSISSQSVGGVAALAVLDQPRRIIVAGPTSVVWADIPPTSGPGVWTDTYVWNKATGPPPAPFSLAIGSRDRTLRTKPAGTPDTTFVIGGSYGGIWVGDWRSGTLNFTDRKSVV
jgi:hypothetical protein